VACKYCLTCLVQGLWHHASCLQTAGSVVCYSICYCCMM
jgi:hypothetical protein